MTRKWMPFSKYANIRSGNMKTGLNRMHVAQFHKLLKKQVPLNAIAKRLHTTVEVLKRFTPEKVAAGAKRAKQIEQAAVAASGARHETVKAAVAGAVAATTPATIPPIVDDTQTEPAIPGAGNAQTAAAQPLGDPDAADDALG